MTRITKEEGRAILAFASKGPIVSSEAQRIAWRSYGQIRHLFSELERRNIINSWSDVSNGKGSSRFSQIMNAVIAKFEIE